MVNPNPNSCHHPTPSQQPPGSGSSWAESFSVPEKDRKEKCMWSGTVLSQLGPEGGS